MKRLQPFDERAIINKPSMKGRCSDFWITQQDVHESNHWREIWKIGPSPSYPDGTHVETTKPNTQDNWLTGTYGCRG